MSALPTGTPLHVQQVAAGGKGFVLVQRLVSNVWVSRPETLMCSFIVPTTDVMSTAENRVENGGAEEELKGTKRKISLSK